MADNPVVADDVKKAVLSYEDTRPPRDGNRTGGLVGLAKYIARRFLKNESRWQEVHEFVKRRFRANHIVQDKVCGVIAYWPRNFAPERAKQSKRRPVYAF